MTLPYNELLIVITVELVANATFDADVAMGKTALLVASTKLEA
jgi:hypothetical protein